MKVIILAAGLGSRLRPITNTRPKCLVNLLGTPLLSYQLSIIKQCGIKDHDIAVVTGYMKELIYPYIKTTFNNPNYSSTNMVHSLFCAESFMDADQDLIISYGDIVYRKEILENLIKTEDELAVVADRDWNDLWSIRMEDPLTDAESFKVNSAGKLIELGKPINSLHEAPAQYLGLIKVKASSINKLKNSYQKLNGQNNQDSQSFKNMFMTSFIQHLIECGWSVSPSYTNGGWIEVDSVADLRAYENDDEISRMLNKIMQKNMSQ